MQILQQIKQCQICHSSLPLPPRPILQASNKSRIIIAGQAPGLTTHNKGIPFDDKSGDRLRNWLSVSREQFYNPDLFAIIPMGFCYPGKGKSGDLPPLPICATTWRKRLLAQLKQVQLTIILGKYAARWHLQTDATMTQLGKEWQQRLRNGNIALPHPSPRNNRWLKTNPWFENETIVALQQKVVEILAN